eukprot:Platyproteum_vivax@DN6433_c0_g1_i2.p2
MVAPTAHRLKGAERKQLAGMAPARTYGGGVFGAGVGCTRDNHHRSQTARVRQFRAGGLQSLPRDFEECGLRNYEGGREVAQVFNKFPKLKEVHLTYNPGLGPEGLAGIQDSWDSDTYQNLKNLVFADVGVSRVELKYWVLHEIHLPSLHKVWFQDCANELFADWEREG